MKFLNLCQKFFQTKLRVEISLTIKEELTTNCYLLFNDTKIY